MLVKLHFVLLVVVAAAFAQSSYPTPYTEVDRFFHLPASRLVGATSAIGIDPDGKTIWVASRCGADTCEGSLLPPVLKFDSAGIVLRSFGDGLILFPHGLAVDKNGDIWVADGHAKDGKGMQVWKFSPTGKVLNTLGKPGGGEGRDGFNQPNAVAIAPNGDIFVSEGHNPRTGSARIVKFDKDGKYLMEWGKLGSGPGEFRVPHALAFDSGGRLFVGDRGNDRIQIFDQNGKFIAEWKQFGGPSGLYIDKNDVLYAADAGIRIGSAKDGTVTAFIPGSAEGVAVDAAGNVFGAEVDTRSLKKYVPK